MNPKPFTGDLFAVPLETFWTATVHGKENSSSNQKHLDKNRVHFGGQNKKVFEHLMEGWEFTIRQAVANNIMSLPRRIKDLTDTGIKISWRWNNGEEKFKIWFMSEEDKLFNKSLIEKRG